MLDRWIPLCLWRDGGRKREKQRERERYWEWRATAPLPAGLSSLEERQKWILHFLSTAQIALKESTSVHVASPQTDSLTWSTEDVFKSLSFISVCPSVHLYVCSSAVCLALSVCHQSVRLVCLWSPIWTEADLFSDIRKSQHWNHAAIPVLYSFGAIKGA